MEAICWILSQACPSQNDILSNQSVELTNTPAQLSVWSGLTAQSDET